MPDPKLSVILPVYNASAFVNEAVDSILQQDFRDFEFIIADDGSSDDSLLKLRQYSDKRIRIITNAKNQGLIATLNTCLTECKGEFIARMDADDISAPGRFTQQLQAFQKHPEAGLVSSFMGIIGAPGRVVKHRFIEPADVKAALPFTNPVVHPSVMFRASCLPTRNLYNPRYLHAEDYGLWIELMPQMEYKVIPLPLLHHRSHQAQVSVTHYEQQKKSITRAHEQLCNYLGITPSKEDLAMQLSLFLEQFESDVEYIDHAEKWLIALTTANRSTLLMPTREFESVAGEWWFRLNQSLAGKGISSMNRYKQSELSKMYSPPLASSAKLFARSFLKPNKSRS